MLASFLLLSPSSNHETNVSFITAMIWRKSINEALIVMKLIRQPFVSISKLIVFPFVMLNNLAKLRCTHWRKHWFEVWFLDLDWWKTACKSFVKFFFDFFRIISEGRLDWRDRYNIGCFWIQFTIINMIHIFHKALAFKVKVFALGTDVVRDIFWHVLFEKFHGIKHYIRIRLHFETLDYNFGIRVLHFKEQV